ncbi:hypothetical protein PM082_017873 [Marasmius tenuissimus]|nr:hypothetical protein PM082_017873 [Marasmius tenuissimus]
MLKRVLFCQPRSSHLFPQYLRPYHQVHHPSRSVIVSFTPENRTEDRKYKLLHLANAYGSVHNLWGDRQSNSLLIEFTDVDAAQRFKTALESRKTVKVQYGNPPTGTTPRPSVVSRIWNGLSRNLRIVPSPAASSELREEEVGTEFERAGIEVAKVWIRKDYIGIEMYVLRHALRVSNQSPSVVFKTLLLLGDECVWTPLQIAREITRTTFLRLQ